MAVAVGISYLSSLGAELLAFTVLRPSFLLPVRARGIRPSPVLDYPLPVWLYSIRTSPIEMLDPKTWV